MEKIISGYNEEKLILASVLSRLGSDNNVIVTRSSLERRLNQIDTKLVEIVNRQGTTEAVQNERERILSAMPEKLLEESWSIGAIEGSFLKGRNGYRKEVIKIINNL